MYLSTSNVQCRISNHDFQLYFNQTFRQPIPRLKHIEFCPFCEKKDKKVLLEGGLHLACCRSNPTRYSPHNRTIQVLRHFARFANLVDSLGERVYNCNSYGNGKFLNAHFRGYIAVNGSRREINSGIDVSFVDPFAKSFMKIFIISETCQSKS